jgi:hypothetical protein
MWDSWLNGSYAFSPDELATGRRIAGGLTNLGLAPTESRADESLAPSGCSL